MLPEKDNSFVYLPISEENLLWDLYITGVGFAHICPGRSYPPKGHPEVYDFKWKTGRVLPEYQIIYILQGRGVFESVYTGTIYAPSPASPSSQTKCTLSGGGETLGLLSSQVICYSMVVTGDFELDITHDKTYLYQIPPSLDLTE